MYGETGDTGGNLGASGKTGNKCELQRGKRGFRVAHLTAFIRTLEQRNILEQKWKGTVRLRDPPSSDCARYGYSSDTTKDRSLRPAHRPIERSALRESGMTCLFCDLLAVPSWLF